VFRLYPGEIREIPLTCEKDGQYALAVVSEGVDDLDLAVLDKAKSKALAQSKDVNPHPDLKFKVSEEGVYNALVRNPTDSTAQVAVIRFQK
jgi:hypothetical protein